MKRIFFFLLISLPVLLSSCSTDDDYDKNWYKKNIDAYNAIKETSGYQRVDLAGAPNDVYYKPEKNGTGTKSPIQTSKVKVLYTGMYYDGTVFEEGSDPEYPSVFPVNGVIGGLGIAFQAMKEGDVWEIWVPWYLGYGSSANGNIPAYSTLIYKIELLEITEY